MNNKLLWASAVNKATEILREVAKGCEIITYKDLSKSITTAHIEPHSNDMNLLLKEIALSEVSQGRPMLPAIVVNEKTKEPGPGFFIAADEAGKEYTDETQFWINELKAVHQYWSK